MVNRSAKVAAVAGRQWGLVTWAQIQRDRSNELRLRAADFEVRRYGWVQLEDELTLVETDLRRALGLPR